MHGEICLKNIIHSTTRSNFISAYMSHFDKLEKLPSGFVVVASTKNSEYAGIAHQTKPIYGKFPVI
jgi:GMP synthase (glutamine-hydrolysing)